MLSTLTALAFLSTGLLWAILGISFLIAIHEYGHFKACRLTGTRVETFSIGFGPRLFGWESLPGEPRRFTLGKRRLDPVEHAMDVRVALVPLGGYVKMAGENPGEERTGAGDEYASKPIRHRLFIVSAGVIMNALTAFVFYAVCHGGGLRKDAPIVGNVQPGSAAWQAGLEAGDRVLSIDGRHLDSFLDLRLEAAFLATHQDREVVVERAGQRVTLPARSRYDEKMGVGQLGVRGAMSLVAGTGAGALALDGTEAVRVDGREVRGGLAAAQEVMGAFLRGKESVEVLRVRDGQGATLRLGSAPAGAAEALPLRLGLVGAGPATVAAARGPAAGLKAGDRIVAVRGAGTVVEVADRRSLDRLEARLAAVEAVEVERGGERVAVPVAGVADVAAVARLADDIVLAAGGPLVVAPSPAGSLSEMVEGSGIVVRQAASPCEGLVPPGSRLLEVGSRVVSGFEDVRTALATARPGETLPLRIEAPGEAASRVVMVTPERPALVGAVALALAPVKESIGGTGVLDAVAYGGQRLGREVINVFRTIGGFFSGQIAFSKNVAGPITLVNASSKASQEGFLDLLWFLAYVSVMLAVLNILPVPVLDGGHVVLLLAEKLRGKPLSDTTIGRLQLGGLLLMLTLMFFALKNDVLINFLR